MQKLLPKLNSIFKSGKLKGQGGSDLEKQGTGVKEQAVTARLRIGFLNLPLEIREIIYEYALGGHEIHLESTETRALRTNICWCLADPCTCDATNIQVPEEDHWRVHSTVCWCGEKRFVCICGSSEEPCPARCSRNYPIIRRSAPCYCGAPLAVGFPPEDSYVEEPANWHFGRHFLGLLLSCRLVYHEVTNLLYSRNHFVISTPQTLFALQTKLQTTSFESIQELSIVWPFFQEASDYKYWEKACDALAQMKGLQTLFITLRLWGQDRGKYGIVLPLSALRDLSRLEQVKKNYQIWIYHQVPDHFDMRAQREIRDYRALAATAPFQVHLLTAPYCVYGDDYSMGTYVSLVED